MHTYLIAGHARLKQLRELRECDTHKEYYQYNPSLVVLRECDGFSAYGHLPTLDDLDNQATSYTRLVDYA